MQRLQRMLKRKEVKSAEGMKNSRECEEKNAKKIMQTIRKI